MAQIFSSEDPESLRGPQFEAAWCDELSKWKNADACFDMLQFGLRLGEPAAPAHHHDAEADAADEAALSRSGGEGAANGDRRQCAQSCAGISRRDPEQRYGGSRLGRQELDGELIEDRDDALWSRALVESVRTPCPAELRRIVVAVDPPATATKTSDACGIVAAGLDPEGMVIVLADATVRAAKPQEWASVAIGLFHRLEADCLVVETNQGGDMVGSRDRDGRSGCAGEAGQGDPREMGEGRAGRRTLPSGQGAACGALSGAGG